MKRIASVTLKFLSKSHLLNLILMVARPLSYSYVSQFVHFESKWSKVFISIAIFESWLNFCLSSRITAPIFGNLYEKILIPLRKLIGKAIKKRFMEESSHQLSRRILYCDSNISKASYKLVRKRKKEIQRGFACYNWID